MHTPNAAAAIIAGGSARRLGGQDKSRLVVEGRSIIVRQLDVLQQVAREVFVVANDPARFADLGLRVVADRIPGTGAMGGLYTALEATRAERVIVVAGDLPFLEAGLLRHLTRLAGDGDGAWIRSSRGVEPLLACYRRRAAGRVGTQVRAGRLKLADLGSVLAMSEVSEAELAAFGSVDRLLANINTPEDYARVQ